MAYLLSTQPYPSRYMTQGTSDSLNASLAWITLVYWVDSHITSKWSKMHSWVVAVVCQTSHGAGGCAMLLHPQGGHPCSAQVSWGLCASDASLRASGFEGL